MYSTSLPNLKKVYILTIISRNEPKLFVNRYVIKASRAKKKKTKRRSSSVTSNEIVIKEVLQNYQNFWSFYANAQSILCNDNHHEESIVAHEGNTSWNYLLIRSIDPWDGDHLEESDEEKTKWYWVIIKDLENIKSWFGYQTNANQHHHDGSQTWKIQEKLQSPYGQCGESH